ncbi:hypothetical protein SARC_03983 [Sphaeroforma arctica JP610]|uniref:Uncharacterized protein n=1 Tax=Sphaeroforma arctica JP610 TaxID=667725 RepID=A0A0L0G3X3_9EUKA|nr:hypothetical protein SARC_03983 [Sphaeroforma arctica JP610]KNC83807.1 hypothetical protein SARC_03983 [Sphaeroforma arctica JP610]|eukprot:XP_014157709.1 hypothetical protein SARC_03983 [Sphaeroforma arctica JP610]
MAPNTVPFLYYALSNEIDAPLRPSALHLTYGIAKDQWANMCYVVTGGTVKAGGCRFVVCRYNKFLQQMYTDETQLPRGMDHYTKDMFGCAPVVVLSSATVLTPVDPEDYLAKALVMMGPAAPSAADSTLVPLYGQFLPRCAELARWDSLLEGTSKIPAGMRWLVVGGTAEGQAVLYRCNTMTHRVYPRSKNISLSDAPGVIGTSVASLPVDQSREVVAKVEDIIADLKRIKYSSGVITNWKSLLAKLNDSNGTNTSTAYNKQVDRILFYTSLEIAKQVNYSLQDLVNQASLLKRYFDTLESIPEPIAIYVNHNMPRIGSTSFARRLVAD